MARLSMPSTQVMLGHDVGWCPEPNAQQHRAEAALQRLRRIVILCLTKTDCVKLCSTYVTPMLYGFDAVGLGQTHQKLDKTMKQQVWGTARHAACWPAAISLCLLSFHVIVTSDRGFAEAAMILHHAMMISELKEEVKELWALTYVPRIHGIWTTLVKGLSESRYFL